MNIRFLFVPLAFLYIAITQWITYDADYDVTFGVEVIDKLVDTCGVRMAGTPANEICAPRLLVETMREIG